jgi:hypothetical protein
MLAREQRIMAAMAQRELRLVDVIAALLGVLFALIRFTG